jgi:hypothetical protein
MKRERTCQICEAKGEVWAWVESEGRPSLLLECRRRVKTREYLRSFRVVAEV